MVDVAAPGGDTAVDRNGDGYADGVLSTSEDDSRGAPSIYVFYQGTSMASPHVAGVAALMRAVNPALTPALFDTLLASGALTTDLGTAGRDDIFGHGLIDARKAVEAAAGTTPDTPFLLVSPTGLNLGTSQTQTSFQVSNGGGGTLTIASVTDDQPWLVRQRQRSRHVSSRRRSHRSRERHLHGNHQRRELGRERLRLGRDGGGVGRHQRQTPASTTCC